MNVRERESSASTRRKTVNSELSDLSMSDPGANRGTKKTDVTALARRSFIIILYHWVTVRDVRAASLLL